MSEYTKGTWKVQRYLHGLHIAGMERPGKAHAKVCSIEGNEPFSEEVEANAELIADAGTTANACDMLPSEILAQRNELLQALRNCYDGSAGVALGTALKNAQEICNRLDP